MLSVYVGEDKFLKGVSIYLKKHLYANSVAEDLWAGIQEATSVYMLASHSNIGWYPLIAIRLGHSSIDDELDC